MKTCRECGTPMTLTERTESGTPPYIQVREFFTCPNCELNIGRMVWKKVDAPEPKEETA
jgi:uncharacterized protein with PIN domain